MTTVLGKAWQPRKAGAWGRALGLLLAWVALHAQTGSSGALPSAEPQPEAPALWVDFHDGRLSVETQAASWETVLQEVRRQTGIRLHLHLPLAASPTIAFHALPVERALRRLFGPEANFIFLYHNRHPVHPTDGLPAEVWVIGRAGPESSAPLRLAEHPAESGAPTRHDELDSGQTPQPAQEIALSDPDPERRLIAIAHLGQQATPEAVSVLASLVHDPDPYIQEGVVAALAPLATHDPQVSETLIHMMQTAEEPNIRGLVADALGIPPDVITPKDSHQ